MTPFWKMHGLGNDFVLIRQADWPKASSPAQIRALADRQRGIGFDQLLLIDPDTPGFVIFNADGSIAEQCGNGLRCVAAWLGRENPALGSEFVLHSPAGEHSVQLHADGEVSASMGCPAIGAQLPLPEGSAAPMLQAVSMGNPHAVARVDDVDGLDLAALAQQAAAMPTFPDGVNVGALQVLAPDRARLRVFERGAGETQACGSGACAAMAAARHNGWLSERAELLLPGGRLVLKWNQPRDALWMRGPATAVYHGFIDLSMQE